MVQLSAPTPNYFQVNGMLYSNVGHYQIKTAPPRVALFEISGANERQIISPTNWDEFTDDQGQPYASFDDLVFNLSVLTAAKTDIAPVTLEFLIDRNAELEGSPGVVNMAVNASAGAPQVFSAPMLYDSILSGITMYLEDGNFDSGNFGGLPALTNGCILMIGAQPVALLKTNRDIVNLSTSTTSHDFLASLSRHMVSRREFDPRLILKQGEKVSMIIQDNLSAMDIFTLNIQGNRL